MAKIEIVQFKGGEYGVRRTASFFERAYDGGSKHSFLNIMGIPTFVPRRAGTFIQGFRTYQEAEAALKCWREHEERLSCPPDVGVPVTRP